MSSLPGSNSLSKGDKKKYNTLDINNYQGKGVELQKSTANRQHGMQSLGKVPTARRIPPPVALPSLKSENSGNDPTVNLVPSGPASTGWGSGKSATSKSQQPSGQQSKQPPTSTSSSVTSRSPAAGTTRETPGGPVATGSSGGSGVGTVSQPMSTSSIRPWSMLTPRTAMFDQEKPTPAASAAKGSGKFTREFPSLEGSAQTSGSGGKTGSSTQLDLRPQNVGSWREGGGKNITSDHQTDDSRSASRRTDPRGDSDDDDLEDYKGSSYNGRVYGQKSNPDNMATDGGLFKRSTIVKDRDIEELGHKAASRAKNDDSNWATASGEIDYSVKLVFSDDEDAGGNGRSAGREGRPKRSTPPATSGVSAERTRGDGAGQTDKRPTGDGYERDRGRGRDRDHGGTREAWPPHQYPPYPHQAMVQQRMQYDMWQRANQPPGGKMPHPPSNMPPGAYGSYRMPFRPPLHSQFSGEDDDEMWRRKQTQTQANVNTAIERAKSKRGEESEESRRSRSASESSSNEQTQSRSARYGNDGRKSQNQVPPRFQQKNSEKSAERGPSGGSRNDENRPPYYTQQSGGGGGQPPWPMGWPMHAPPPHWIPGMPPPPMQPSRPRNNSRSSDDDRRTPDQNFSHPPPFNYDVAMRQWVAMMQEFSKANPEVPLPPLPPVYMMHPPRGMVPPHSQPAPPVAAAQKERDRQVSESAADKESLAADSKSSEGVKSEKIKDEDIPTSKSKVQPDPFSDNPEPQANGKRKESGGSEARPLSVSSDDKRFSTKEDAAGPGKPSRSSASSKSDRRDDRKGSRVEDRTSKSKHADQDGYRSGRHGRYRDDIESRDTNYGEGRKRRSEMAAPIPVVKESLRADPDRQRQMVTLKRPTKSSAPASSSGGSSSAAKTEDLQRVAKQSSVVEKSTTQKANSGKEDSSKPAHPKQSAWGPTPAAQPASITSQNVEAKVAAPATSTAAAVATSDTSAAAKNGATVSAGNGFNREDRSKVSPAYSDTEKPPVKRYKEGREHGGTAGRYERSNSRGGRSEHHSERGQRRGGARPREFVRGGSASLGRGGPGRSSGVGGRGSRSVSSRGRGGSTRDSYERFNSRDYREDTYTAEDWEGERAPPKRDTRSSKPEASNGPKESTKPPPSKESQRQQSSLDPNTSSTSTAASGATPTTTAANKPTAPAAVVSEAPPPKENVWHKRQQEMSMRDGPSPTPPVNGVAADSVESATSPQHTDTKEPKGNEPKTGEEQPVGDRSVRRDDRRRGKGRPTKDTYVAPGSRARGGGNSRSQRTSDYYNYSEGYDEAYDSGRYGRGSSRPRASRGRGSYQSSRGNHPAHRGASRTNSRDDAGDKGPKIDQWNGPPEDGGADGHRRLDDAWDKGEQGYSQSYRGRGRGRGSRYSTRGQTTRGRGRHSTLPSSALSPVKRRQDSTNTENDPQEEWETASESSEHLKESGNQSNSRSHKQLEGDDSSQHRGNGANYRGSSRGYRGSGERGRGRGGSRGGGSSRSGHRGSSARDNGKYKEKGSDEKDTSSAASGARGNRTMTNGKAGNSTVYRLDDVSLDSPAAVAAALSNKNSELSDVSKPLSSKDKTANLKGNHSSSTKESVPAVVDPLDGFDLNNYAGVVIIDHMGDPGEESDSWQDEDGFQEVVSRKTRKHRQEQEAAAKAAIEAKAVELLKKERAAASGSRRGHGAQHSAAATSRPRKSKLPPRFLKQHEGKPKTDKFKIEQWDSELMERGAPSRPPQTKSVQEPPLQIGNWDQNMAVSESTVPATTTSTLTSINSRLGVSSASLTSVQSVGLSLDTKPSPSTGDKSSGSEQHDSGIDVSNDKDTGSVRSSPDAGTIVSPQMRSSLIGQPPHSHYPSALSPTQHGSTQHGSSASFTKSPITSRTAAVSNLNPTDSSHKLDFTFDTKQGSGTSAATSEISSAAAPSEVGAEFNMKLDSVKNLWPSAQKTNTNQLFGSNDTPSFQSPPSEVYEQQVELTAAGTTFSSNEGFPAARNDGYSLPPTNQSATNMFVSPGAEASSASAIGTRQPPSPRPPVNQLVSPRVTKSAGNVSGSVISGSASVDSEAPPSQPHSSQSLLTQSTLDGAASVFTPTFQPTYKGSLAPAQSPSATSLSSAILSHQQPSQNYGFMVNPASQQSLVDSSYGSFRSHSVSQHHSVSQPLQPSPALSTQQTNMAPMGLQQTALHQPPYLQSNMSAAVAASSQHFPQAMLMSSPSVVSPMIKATTMTLSNNFPSTKVSQFDVSSNQTSMQYLHQFDMPGIMGSQPVSSVTAPPPQSGAFRMPTPPAQNNQITQPHQSPFFSASTQNQNPIGFYAAPSTIQGASQSGFAIGLMSHPTAGAAIVPQGSLVLPQQTTSPWPQQPSITPQSLKQFKAAGPTAVGNQMKVQLANHAAVMTSQPPFQMTVGAGSTGQPSNSAGVDYNMRMAAQHLQQPSAPIAPKWGQPPNQQADKSHVTGASQLISASHMGGAKMGGANMMPAGSQLSMQKNLKPGFPTAGPPQRAAFNPRMNMAPPQMSGAGAVPGQQNRRHPSSQLNVSRQQFPGHPRGTSLHSRSRFSQPPIQRPVQNRPSGTRSSNTPPANAGQQVNKGSQSSEEEKMKGRADVLNVTKNFLNPTTKPSVLTPSSASFTDTSLKVADAAGDTQLQVTTVPAAKTADIPSLAKAACDSSSSDATTLPSDTPPVAVGDMQ